MILRFTDKLPKALYLDSSVILNATMTGGRFDFTMNVHHS